MYTENKLWSSLSKLISSKIHIVTQDGIFKESIEARNKGGMESSYRPARPHNLFLGIDSSAL
jgi:hypothetical protein